ncbi:MAG TPA: class I SAM-dependent methyltransferase [Solirubrobacteraceae bacterium]|jgi:ubiquinone/menaquinone biosynthesis C-methylase UbiE
MAMEHARRIEQAFTAQAAAFEDPSRNQVFTADARWVFERLPLSAQDVVLDVAAGTGHAARQLAATARTVVALDATEAMLARGQAQAAAEGRDNVLFMRGDAAALPFLDGSFDVVVSRFAAHHFERPGAVVSEMVRCTRPGGHVALVDLVADEDPEVAAEQNRLERLRDPSHTRMLAATRIQALLREAGVESIDVATRPLERRLGPWLQQAQTDEAVRDEIRAALRADIGGGAVTGFRPRAADDGELWFAQTFASAIASRPS